MWEKRVIKLLAYVFVSMLFVLFSVYPAYAESTSEYKISVSANAPILPGSSVDFNISVILNPDKNEKIFIYSVMTLFEWDDVWIPLLNHTIYNITPGESVNFYVHDEKIPDSIKGDHFYYMTTKIDWGYMSDMLIHTLTINTTIYVIGPYIPLSAGLVLSIFLSIFIIATSLLAVMYWDLKKKKLKEV